MRRFSVRSLMVFIVGAAVGLAALRNADVYWAGGMFIADLAALATSLVGIIILRGRERCAWAGFGVFTGMYLLFTLGNVLSEDLESRMITTAALKGVARQASAYRSDPTKPTYVQEWRDRILADLKLLEKNPVVNQSWIVKYQKLLLELDATIADENRQHAIAARWRRWLPGIVNQGDFVRIGQCLLALLAGLAGSAVGRMFYARRRRNETQTS